MADDTVMRRLSVCRGLRNPKVGSCLVMWADVSKDVARAQSHDTPKYYVLIPRNMPAGISSQLLLAIITDVEHWNRIEVIK